MFSFMSFYYVYLRFFCHHYNVGFFLVVCCVGCECITVFFSSQKDDMDGEIDLKSCVKVSEFDVEKNYGFQIQVNISVISYTLSWTLYMWPIFLLSAFVFPNHTRSVSASSAGYSVIMTHISLSVSPPLLSRSLSVSLPFDFPFIISSHPKSVTFLASP